MADSKYYVNSGHEFILICWPFEIHTSSRER